jgi:poly-gamma-glutamate synthesis protein (capsule biosynthesis protein)
MYKTCQEKRNEVGYGLGAKELSVPCKHCIWLVAYARIKSHTIVYAKERNPIMQKQKKLWHYIVCIFSLCFLFTGCASEMQQKTKTHRQNNTNPPAQNTVSQKAQEPIANGAAKKKKKTTSITISAAGDCTFGSDRNSPASVNFYSVYNKKKPEYFFRNVRNIFEKDDLTLVNFEGTLTDSTSRMDKTYAFKGSPSYIRLLKKGAIEAVSFANNHCRDYGEQSYTDTINTFQKAGIKYASYDKVSIYKTKGIRIGMVAVNGLLGADYSKNLIASGIKKLKKRQADLIIVSMHAGIEHTSTLNAVQTDLAHYAVKKGANLVLGHHPHTLQGIERYKGAYIVYSLANFCFGGNTNPSDKDTIIFQQTFTFKNKKLKKDKNMRIIPCMVSSTSAINNYQPTPLKGAARQRIIQKMNTYSRPLGVQFSKNGKVKL